VIAVILAVYVPTDEFPLKILRELVGNRSFVHVVLKENNIIAE
jgi:hypothetical protein